MVGIRAEFSATKFRAEFCSDLKQSPKFLLFLLAVISIIYLQTGTLGQSGIIRKSWEFVKRSLLHERNYEEFLWNLTGEERRHRGILQEPPPWRRREQGSRRGILQDPPTAAFRKSFGKVFVLGSSGAVPLRSYLTP